MEQAFTISIPQEALDNLQQKLALTRFPDAPGEDISYYGVPLADIRRLVSHWRHTYDWKAQEKRLNELPQFTRDIPVDGFGVLNIHYVHQRSAIDDAIPLLFVHGWPGSFIEVAKILPLLTKPKASNNPSFHVVALSLPGFGFSQSPKRPGFALAQYAEVGHKLMLALGYHQYITQGGDWGSLITSRIASTYGPEYAKAWHTNMPYAKNPPRFKSHPRLYLQHLLTSYTAQDRVALERSQWYFTQQSGYMLQQSTQPQTLGYSLQDSPVGLLAWIYDRLINWTDSYPWDDDEVLTWISIYWFSRNGPDASLRIYRDVIGSTEIEQPSTIPMGVSYFPKEVLQSPRIWIHAVGNLVFEGSHQAGGHFAAHEKPNELVGDLQKMFGKGGPAFGVIPDATGYNRSAKL